jgi:Pyruvate/2-oxoacid:ferredoxin oxidoreductase delta subunit
MGHITAKKNYEKLVRRLNRFPQGAPPTATLYRILEILFNPREAELTSKLPIQGFAAEEAAKRWELPLSESIEILDQLARRAILVDIVKDGKTTYVLPPPMAGFIEFSMMRIRNDIDQHSLGQLLHQYMNVEEDFVRELFYGTETKMVRTFVNEGALPQDDVLEIMNYERATEIIKSATHIGLGVCYCRHKMEHVGKNCDAPMEICMTFGNTADSLIRSDYAKRITADECLSLLQTAYDHNLVQIGENVQNEVAFICNCCGCCCEALLAAQRFGSSQTIATTNYLPHIDHTACTACGKCVKVCPVKALDWTDGKAKGNLHLIEDMCLGCGVCVRNCHFNALTLEKRDSRIITPMSTAHRVVLAAIDKGMLANLFFDNEALASHRIMGALLSAILSLTPAKQLLANEQIRSKYLVKLIEKAREKKKKT